ncbi:MAG: protein kinase [Planctomycetes bacterium]|nr:protein kinase [Planctomycetota bacterium]
MSDLICPNCGMEMPSETVAGAHGLRCPACGQKVSLKDKAGEKAEKKAGSAKAPPPKAPAAASKEVPLVTEKIFRPTDEFHAASRPEAPAPAPAPAPGSSAVKIAVKPPENGDAVLTQPVVSPSKLPVEGPGHTVEAKGLASSEEKLGTRASAESDGVFQPPVGSLTDLVIGKTIGGCRILSLLGRGAMGAVYKATQLSLDRLVALKTIRQDFCTDENFLSRFRQEARTVGRFSTPHVVQIHEVGYDQGVHYLVMEYVSGGNLRSFVENQPDKRLSAEDAIRFIRQAAEGLLEAEKLKIIHRDIKPENLLLDHNQRLKIADFGIAKVLSASVQMTATASILGTPLYMSPEQAQGRALDQRSDLYSLGATFFHLLTGIPPIKGDSVYDLLQKKSEIDFLSPMEMLADHSVPEDLSSMVEKMTALHAEDRYVSFQELIEDLDRISEGKSIKAAPPPRGKAVARRPEKRASRKLAATLAVLLVLGGGGYAAWRYYTTIVTQGPRNDSSQISSTHPAGQQKSGQKPSEQQPSGSGAVAASTSTSPSTESTGSTTKEPPPAASTTTSPPVEPPLTGDDVKVQVIAIKNKLRQDPGSQVGKDADELLKKILPHGADFKEYKEELEKLRRDNEHGNRVKDQLLATDGEIAKLKEEAAVPFKNYPALWTSVQEILTAPDSAGLELKNWLQDETRSRAKRLQELAEAALGKHQEQLRAKESQLQNWEIDLTDFKPLVESLEEAKTTLRKVFPERFDRWDQLLPASQVSGFKEASAKREKAEQKIQSLKKDLGGIETVLAGLQKATSGPEKIHTEVKSGLEKIKNDLAAFEKENPRAPVAALKKQLEGLAGQEMAWGNHLALFQTALQSFAERRLEATAQTMDALRQDRLENPLLEKLAAGREDMVRAFKALFENLNLDEAGMLFASAQGQLEGLGGCARYPQECLARLKELRGVTGELRDMAPVPGGKVLISEKETSKDIEGFFIDRYEVSIKSYGEFVKYLVGKKLEEVRSLWPPEVDEALYQDYASLPPSAQENTDPTWPVEEVNYYQAQAYLLWKKKDLPTLEEWWLAAKGSLKGGRHRDLPSLSADLRKSAEFPVAVNRGGIVQGFSSQYSVHHLAGNVAEWLKVKGKGTRQSQLAGGCYLNNDEDHFTGKNRDTMALNDTRQGYGFRGVVRPKEFFKGLLPDEKP